MFRLALLPVLLLTACSAERRALRKDRYQSTVLGARAQRCWDYVRWADVDAAAGCVDGQENRVAYQEYLRALAKDERVDEVEVLHVNVSPLKDPPGEDGHLREAEVTIRKDAYRLPGQVLRTETFQQHWYMLKSGWYLEWP